MLPASVDQIQENGAPLARPVQVLLVEDDDVDIMAVRRAFRASKIDNPLWIARDGIEALAILRGEDTPPIPRPYMILLDLNMPRMGGLEFLRELRADPVHRHAMVFVLTTSAADEDKAAAYEELVAGYIVKANAGHDFLRVIRLLEAYWDIVDSNDVLLDVNASLRAVNAEITEKNQEATRLQQRLQQMAFAAAVAAERERRRIAVDLHDRIGQSLALAQIKLSSLRGALPAPTREALDQAVELIEQSLLDTRTLTFELSPPVLYDLGLAAALSWLAEEVERRHGVAVELHDDGAPKALDDVTASLVFRAVRELLMNVLKHAKAPSAKVSLKRSGDRLEIVVEDEGVGFNPDEASPRAHAKGFGLFSVREQINRLGGSVDVVSAPERGTRVSLRIPLTVAPLSGGDEVERAS